MISPEPLEQLVNTFPEVRACYPLTIVMDEFADRVSDAVREDKQDEFVRRAFEFIEELALTRDLALQNLIIVCFIEAASWGKLGVKHLFGPATRELIAAADPRMIDPLLRDAS